MAHAGQHASLMVPDDGVETFRLARLFAIYIPPDRLARTARQ
jgi:hypothetical protein